MEASGIIRGGGDMEGDRDMRWGGDMAMADTWERRSYEREMRHEKVRGYEKGAGLQIPARTDLRTLRCGAYLLSGRKYIFTYGFRGRPSGREGRSLAWSTLTIS